MSSSFWVQDGAIVVEDGVFCVAEECPCEPEITCDYFSDPVSDLDQWTTEAGSWSEV